MPWCLLEKEWHSQQQKKWWTLLVVFSQRYVIFWCPINYEHWKSLHRPRTLIRWDCYSCSIFGASNQRRNRLFICIRIMIIEFVTKGEIAKLVKNLERSKVEDDPTAYGFEIFLAAPHLISYIKSTLWNPTSSPSVCIPKTTKEGSILRRPCAIVRGVRWPLQPLFVNLLKRLQELWAIYKSVSFLHPMDESSALPDVRFVNNILTYPSSSSILLYERNACHIWPHSGSARSLR